jgi:CSLREA domain-containing protein
VKRGGLLIAGICTAAVAASPAGAATFEVNRTADTTPNGCNQGGCTLREAVIAANARNGEDVVVLRAGRQYRIEIPGADEQEAATGDLDLTGPTVVRASGAGRATVDAGALDRQFEAFARASFRGLKLTDGAAADGGTIQSSGGTISLTRVAITGSGGTAAIDGTGPGRVVLSRSSVRDGTGAGLRDAGGGGARVSRSDFLSLGGDAVIVNDGGGIVFTRSQVGEIGGAALQDSGPGGVRVVRGTFEELAAEAVLDFDAGGIQVTRSRIADVQADAINDFDPGAVRVARTTITNTLAEALLEFSGGGITANRVRIRNAGTDAVNEFDAGPLTAKRVSINGASAEGLLEFGEGDLSAARTRINGVVDVGAEEFNQGSLELSRARITDSDASGASEHDGGGLRVMSSLLQGNAGGISIDGPGAGRVVRSRIVGNRKPTTSGGGVEVSAGATMTVVESVIARNAATGDGGGVFAGGTVRLTNATVANNEAGDDGAGIFAASGSRVSLNAVTVARNVAASNAGGLYLDGPDGQMRVDNSLIALNEAEGLLLTGDDCASGGDPFDSGGHNLLSDDSLCDGFDGPGDVVRANPRIGQLKRNGGPTETVALKRGSPAIGKAGNDAPNRDQRDRKRDRRPDIGAFER